MCRFGCSSTPIVPAECERALETVATLGSLLASLQRGLPQCPSDHSCPPPAPFALSPSLHCSVSLSPLRFLTSGVVGQPSPTMSTQYLDLPLPRSSLQLWLWRPELCGLWIDLHLQRPSSTTNTSTTGQPPTPPLPSSLTAPFHLSIRGGSPSAHRRPRLRSVFC